MKVRIISGAVAAIALFVVMRLSPFVMGVVVFIAALIALYEFYQAVKKVNLRPTKIAGFFMCTLFFLYLSRTFVNGTNSVLEKVFNFVFQQDIIYLVVYILTVFMLTQLIFRYRQFKLEDIAITLLGLIYIPFLLSFILLLRLMSNGYELSWLIFIGAYSTDTFAYFIGKFFGKRKVLPEVSPNKTVAGCIGGVIGSVICVTLYGALYINNVTNLNANIIHYIIIGVLCGIVAQLGDWTASAIKRIVDIKDFGHIMPGHGGILDRIDSLLFVAPAVYFYVKLLVY
ncbi:MAG TPA: phosphatidate cytidylyltransferase [Thermoclostridium sp.]|nr:phosphatidate cytidylyltransferase [Thermoclostridium sp.]